MNIKKIQFLIVLLAFSITSQAQNQYYIDSLSNIIKITNNDTVKANVYKDLSWQLRGSNLTLAENYAKKSLEIYKRQKNFAEQADVMNKLGIIKRNMGLYAEAFEYFFGVIDLGNHSDCSNQIAYANNNIADIYNLLDKYDKALEYSNIANDCFQKLNDKYGLAYSLNMIGIVYKNKQDWNKALQFFTQSLHIREEINFKLGISMSWQNIGDCYLELNNLDSAYISYINSNKLLDSTTQPLPVAYNYFGLGKYYSSKLNYSKAIEYLNKAFLIAKEKKHPRLEYLASDALYEVYFKKQRFKEAYHSLYVASKTKDSLRNTQYIQKITTIELQNKFEKDKALEKLEDAKRKALYESKIYKQQLYSYLMLFLLMLLVVVVVFIILNNKRIKRMNFELNQKNRQIYTQKQTLKRQNSDLKDLVATKDKFFGIIAHDLRNPFHGISLMAELLVDNEDEFTHDEKYQFAREIYKSAQGASKLLENLLIWARSQKKSLKFNPVELNLFESVKEIESSIYSNYKAKNIKLNTSVSANQIIYADENMLLTILRNLLTNAIKYTQVNGEINIRSEENEDSLIVTVSDSGIGMDEQTRQKLFKIDEKLSNPGTEGEKGTGLGLILCKDFVEKHRGKIWVESKLGKGSQFSFRLPNK